MVTDINKLHKESNKLAALTHLGKAAAANSFCQPYCQSLLTAHESVHTDINCNSPIQDIPCIDL